MEHQDQYEPANRLQHRGRHIHSDKHRGPGPRSESARGAEIPAKRPCYWADPPLGLGSRTGAGLAHYQAPSPNGSARGRMCTRNIAAVFAAYFGITNPPEGVFVMVVLVVPIAAIVAMVAARLFARRAPVGEPGQT